MFIVLYVTNFIISLFTFLRIYLSLYLTAQIILNLMWTLNYLRLYNLKTVNLKSTVNPILFYFNEFKILFWIIKLFFLFISNIDFEWLLFYHRLKLIVDCLTSRAKLCLVTIEREYYCTRVARASTDRKWQIK